MIVWWCQVRGDNAIPTCLPMEPGTADAAPMGIVRAWSWPSESFVTTRETWVRARDEEHAVRAALRAFARKGGEK